MWWVMLGLLSQYGVFGVYKVIKDLIPPVVSKPVFPDTVRVHGDNPRSAKGSSTHGQFNDSLFVFRRHGLLHDFFDLFRREDTVQSLKNTFWSRYVDAFAPVCRAQCRKRGFEFLRRIIILDPGSDANGLENGSISLHSCNEQWKSGLGT